MSADLFFKVYILADAILRCKIFLKNTNTII